MGLGIVLAVDSGPVRDDLETCLAEMGHSVVIMARRGQIGTVAADHAPHVVVIDSDRGRVPERVIEWQAVCPGVCVVLVERNPSIETTVGAVRAGCVDVIDYPEGWSRMSALLRTTERDRSARAVIASKGLVKQGLIGDSPGMRAVRDLISRVARAPDTTVLIRGETGTGKELVAEAIHRESVAQAGTLMAINCAAIPASLLESELFGHERGAFTDAVRSRGGLVEAASGGTLFLDEIGDMSVGLQAKLLKVIEEKRSRRLGSAQSRDVKLRVIAATHRNLEKAIAEGTFRQDLYYRLHVVTVDLPPLRQRGDDLALLARHFLAEHAAEHGREPRTISDEALDRLSNHAWPGNVRELRNVIERVVLLSDRQGAIDVEELPPSFGEAGPTGDEVSDEDCIELRVPRDVLSFDMMEKELVKVVLSETSWNKSRSAARLGISRPRLLRLIKKHALTPGGAA